MAQTDSLTIAFIKRGDSFIPSHISDIKKDDTYYLVVNGFADKVVRVATDDSYMSGDRWEVSGSAVDNADQVIVNATGEE